MTGTEELARAAAPEPAPGPEPSALRRFRDLSRIGPFRGLVLAQMAGQAGDGFAQIAFAQLVLFEVGDGATPGALAALLAVTLLPFSLVGPVAGVLIDRFDRRRVLVVASLARIGIVMSALPMLAAEAVVPAYVAVLVLLSTSRFVLVGKGAALPRTISGDLLVPANALSAIGGMSASFIGAVAGATFVHRAPAAGFVVAACLYAAAVLAWSRLGGLGGGYRLESAGRAVRRAMADMADGVRFVARSRAVRQPLLAVAAHRLLLGGGFVVLVLLADERYALEAPAYGLAIFVTGVGAFAGSVLAPRLARRYEPADLLPAAFPAAAAPALVAGFAPSLPMLIAALGLVALAFQTLKILADAVIQRGSPDEVRGRVFAVYDVTYNVAFVGAALLLMPLWDPARDNALLWGTGFGFAVIGLAVARSHRTWPFTAPPASRPAKDRRRWRGRALAVLVAAPLPLAFPEPGWWWLGWVGLVPLFLVVRAAPTVREAGWRAWAGGFGFVVAAQHWLVPNIGPGLVLLGLALGAVWVPWGWVLRGLLGGRPTAGAAAAACALVPAAWTAAEFVRSWEGFGGPWALLGASQWERDSVLSLASLGGVWLVSAVLVSANVAVAAAWAARGRPRALAVVGMIALGAVALGPLWTAVRPSPDPAGTLLVLGAQPGVIHDEQARFDASEAATLAAAGARPDLVVWGESSVGFDFADRPDLLARVVEVAQATGADVLVNTDARRLDVGGIYKASVLIGPEGIRGRYDKIRLVPFGEYIPLRPLLGWLGPITGAADEDRGRGDRLVILESAGIDLGPLVCFELTFPDLSRRLAAEGADLIVVQSSTSTFQGSWAPEQHSSLAALRAVETGRPVLHSTLTGVSSGFDATGQQLGWFGTDHTGAYLVEVPLAQVRTPYVVLGDWVPAAALAGLTVALTLVMVGAARRKSTEVERDGS